VDAIVELLSRGLQQLIGRADGPLHFRLVVMPAVVTLLGIRAGRRDGRTGRRAFLWLTDTAERRALLRSATSDIGRVFIVAVVLDTVYQLYVLRAFYPLQLLIVAISCAVVPYVLSRALATRVTRGARPHLSAPARTSRTRE
jgi:hypothetical protein